eukprot:SAG31_NODE_4508_length_3178_cov_14.175706_1_plen_70_part_00
MRTNTVLSLFVAIVIGFAAVAQRVPSQAYLPLYIVTALIEMWLCAPLRQSRLVASLVHFISNYLKFISN